MQSPPISQAEIDARISSHIDELLELWWAEQGASKPKDLELIALAIHFPRGQAIARWISVVAPAMWAEPSGRSTRRRKSTASIEIHYSRRSAEP